MPTKRETHVKFKILNITNIDTHKETLDTEVIIISKWKIPDKEMLPGYTDNNNIIHNPRQLYGINEYNYKRIPLETWKTKIWNPKLYLTNVLKVYSEEKSYRVIRLGTELYIEETNHQTVKMKVEMNLNYFPVDAQRLEFTIQSKLKSDRILLFIINDQSFIYCKKLNFDEWCINPNSFITIEQNNDYPTIKLTLLATRNSKYYFWNIILINFLIQLVSLSSICVDYLQPEDRLNISVMLLLTNIAFKMANNNVIPTTSYLTHLDKYHITGFGYQTLVIIQNVVARLSNNVYNFDLWSSIFLGGVLFLSHLIFGIRTSRLLKNRPNT